MTVYLIRRLYGAVPHDVVAVTTDSGTADTLMAQYNDHENTAYVETMQSVEPPTKTGDDAEWKKSQAAGW
jgi:thiamine monophosphate kinase